LNQDTTKVILVISVAVVIAMVFLELTLARIVRYTTTYSSGFDLAFFASIVFPQIALGFMIIFSSRIITRNIVGKNTSYLQVLQKIIITSMIIITILLSSIWIEMFVYSKYTMNLVILVVAISYSTSVFALVLLAYRFLIWLKAYRNHVILSYVIASSLLSLTVALTMANVIYMLASQIPIIFRNSSHMLAYVVSNPYFETTFLYVSIASFVSIWLASLFLIREYYAHTNRYKYLLLSIVPLFYFLAQFQPFLIQLFAEFRLSNPMAFGIFYALFISYSKPIGGIFFGLAFFVVARKIKVTPLKDYLVLAGMGLIFFFTANQAIVLNNLTYPPFGVAASSLLGLASFLVFIGIYGSALSFAQDTSIRRKVRDSVSNDFRLMDRIGMSEIQEQISKRVTTITRNLTKEMEIETGIEPSLKEEEVQNYISEVINELQEHKKAK
jgi:hypothetical protein